MLLPICSVPGNACGAICADPCHVCDTVTALRALTSALCVQVHNSRNTRNMVKGFFQALANIPTAAEVARAQNAYVREQLPRRLYSKDFVAH